MLTLDDHVAARVKRADYQHWRSKVESVGGCAKPIRLDGSHRLEHIGTGQPVYHMDGDIFVACGNRRASVCPTCSDRYAADAFHLIRAGLAGGTKGIPQHVTDKPRAFVTLTAPSFGPVHNHRTSARGKAMPCTGCGEYHHRDDPRIGAPVDPDSYDYIGSVLWQAHAGALWSRFTTQLRRELARAAGIPMRHFADHLRLSYGKVAEYQRRGLVHFHAIVRLDGPDGPADPTPSWADLDALDAAVRRAAAAVAITTCRPDGECLELVWGEQVDIRRVNPATAERVETVDGGISEAQLAGYVAKYATKGTGKSEAADRPIRSQLDIDYLRVSEHHRRIIQTAWDLGGLFVYEELNLRRWAHMLAFRGHFLTKSRRYSVTFGDLRRARRAWRLADNLAAADLDADTVAVVNDWTFTGVGYRDDAERELARGIAVRVREHRKTKHHKENDHA
jgi:hypothetical protein